MLGRFTGTDLLCVIATDVLAPSDALSPANGTWLEESDSDRSLFLWFYRDFVLGRKVFTSK